MTLPFEPLLTFYTSQDIADGCLLVNFVLLPTFFSAWHDYYENNKMRMKTLLCNSGIFVLSRLYSVFGYLRSIYAVI